MKKCLLLWLAFVLAASNVQAQKAVDSMRVFYRRGFHDVDPSFRDNRARLDRFLNSVDRALKENRVGKIVIRSYASPDGTAKANERLSERRAEELKAYLVREGNVPAALVEHHAEGIAWGMLREQVAASDVSYRGEVLDILDRTPVWIYDAEGKIVDGRKKRLMDLQGGEPYRHMLEHFFPDLRNSSNTALYLCVEAKGPEKEPQRTVSGISGNGEAPRLDATGSADGSVSHATALPTESPMERISGPVHPFPKHVIGLHAGYCASWIASYGLSSSTRPGYEAGVTYRVGLSRRLPFYFRTGLTFVGKGYEINGFDDSRTAMNYLQIPIGIDYAVSLGRRWAVVPGAGFYYALGVGGKREIGREAVSVFGSQGGFSRHDMGFSCGVDLAFSRFSLGVAYEAGLIDIDKSDTVYGNDSRMIGYKNVRNRCFLIRMGVNF